MLADTQRSPNPLIPFASLPHLNIVIFSEFGKITYMQLNNLWSWLIGSWDWFWNIFSVRIWSGLDVISKAGLPPVLDILIIITVFIVIIIIWFLFLFIFSILWLVLTIGTTIIWIVAFVINLIFDFGWTNYVNLIEVQNNPSF